MFLLLVQVLVPSLRPLDFAVRILWRHAVLMSRGARRKRHHVTDGRADAFMAGGIMALHQEGYSQRQIADAGAEKPDG